MTQDQMMAKVYEEMVHLSREVAWLRSKVEDVHLLTSELPILAERTRQQGKSIMWLWVFIFGGMGATLPSVIASALTLFQ